MIESKLNHSIDWLSMDEFRDKWSHILSFPLRGHMPNTMHRCEDKVIIIDQVAWDLPISSPGSPVICDVPTLLADPLSGAESWNGSICIPWIMEQFVAISLENGIDPNRTLSIGKIGSIDTIAALLVRSYKVWNMKCCSHISSIQIVWLSVAHNRFK